MPRYRARSRQWLREHPLAEHVDALRERARREVFEAHPSELLRLRERPEVLLTGASVADLVGLLGEAQTVELYAPVAERERIVAEHALLPGAGDVTVRWVPDGLKPPPTLGRGVTAVGVPGGTQALERAAEVSVRVGDRGFHVRRPTLVGAILIKARSLMVHDDPASQREDLLRLLSLIAEPRELAAELRDSERRWLREVEERLDLQAPSLLVADLQRRAELAYRLLVRGANRSGGGTAALDRSASPSRSVRLPPGGERGLDR